MVEVARHDQPVPTMMLSRFKDDFWMIESSRSFRLGMKTLHISS